MNINTGMNESSADDPLTREIIAAAIEVHRVLGPGLLESIYEEALCHELTPRGLSFERQKEVDVAYTGQVIKGQRLDLVVNGMWSLKSRAYGNWMRSLRHKSCHI